MHHLQHVVRLDLGIYANNTNMFDFDLPMPYLWRLCNSNYEENKRWWIILDSFITSLLKQIILTIVQRRGFLVMANFNSLKVFFFGNLWTGGCYCHLFWHLNKKSKLIPHTCTWNAGYSSWIQGANILFFSILDTLCFIGIWIPKVECLMLHCCTIQWKAIHNSRFSSNCVLWFA